MIRYTPKALLFDLDGVLINSVDSWWKALNESFNHYCYPSISKNEFIQKYWGHDLRDLLPAKQIQEGIPAFCGEMYKKYLDAITIYTDTIPTLQQLHHFPKAIITNTPSTCTHPILKRLDIARYFSTVVCSDEVGKAKPDPTIIYRACKNLQLLPKDTVMIGDTQSDILAARAAGCPIIGKNISGGDIMISSLTELLPLISKY